jgi:hypothetical protein
MVAVAPSQPGVGRLSRVQPAVVTLSAFLAILRPNGVAHLVFRPLVLKEVAV